MAIKMPSRRWYQFRYALRAPLRDHPRRLKMKSKTADKPQAIARWLFRIGTIWAFILAIPTVALLMPDATWGYLAYYFIAGYGIWIGWFWRSRRKRKLVPAVTLWSFSIIYHSVFILGMIAFIISTEEKILESLFQAFVTDGMAFYSWYWIAVSIMSAVALVSEIKHSGNELDQDGVINSESLRSST